MRLTQIRRVAEAKSLKIVEIPTISHYQPHVGVNQSKSSRKNSKKKKHEYFFRTFPADHLNSTPTPARQRQ
ncbi:hypothetical protein [Bifidobacterium pseudocatenulatum]|uniref:hypothetical protein n=1 Tax=Bifidobacterium pseudocatenulatum TaxID=28026 RepID=UPI0011477A29|nr:hypothetical protein [Bifidobacterium pseudocatenulatum]